MIVPIDEVTRIRGTSDCWILEDKITPDKKGREPYWQAAKWFGTFRKAVSACAEREIRTHPAETLADAIEAVQAITGKYTRILEGFDA